MRTWNTPVFCPSMTSVTSTLVATLAMYPLPQPKSLFLEA
jgi:hypothetical protein